MALNKLSDLNNHLFAQLERLGDEDLKQDELQLEMNRAKAISGIANNIINNAKITLDGAKFSTNTLPQNKSMPEQFKIQ